MPFFNDKRTGDPKWIAGDEEHDAALAESGVAVEAASRISPEPTTWLVQDVIADRAVTVIAGGPGAGKTFFACQLAADATRVLQSNVVLATSGYERAELLRWRLDQAEGDPRRVAFATLTPKGFSDRRRGPTDEEIDERLSILYHTLEAASDPESGVLPVAERAQSRRDKAKVARRHGESSDESPHSKKSDRVRLLVIDDVDGWFGKPGNMLSPAALARVLQRLNELAHTKRLAVVVLVRAQLSVEGRMTARQHSRLTHAASVVWMVVREKAEGVRWFLPLKNNLAADGDVRGRAFELRDGRIVWRDDPVPELAEALLPSAHNSDRRHLRLAAMQWIEEALADGAVPSGEIIKQALSCGISRGTLARALDDLGVRSHKTGFNGGWEMRLPPRTAPQAEPPRPHGGFRVVGPAEDGCAASQASCASSRADITSDSRRPHPSPGGEGGCAAPSSQMSCAPSIPIADGSTASCASSGSCASSASQMAGALEQAS